LAPVKAIDSPAAIELFANPELPAEPGKPAVSEVPPPATEAKTKPLVANELGDNFELF
jgi:hypothetical protein